MMESTILLNPASRDWRLGILLLKEEELGGYISHDGKLIMSDDGDVWVRHSPEDVFGSKEAAREFAKEQKFRPPPNIMPGSPYDIAPHAEHCCRVIANKPLHNSLSSRLVRWMINSKYVKIL